MPVGKGGSKKGAFYSRFRDNRYIQQRFAGATTYYQIVGFLRRMTALRMSNRNVVLKDKRKPKEKGQQLWFRLVLFLVPRLVTAYFRLVDLTSKKIYLNQEYEEQICKKQPFNCACFHGTMLFPVYHCGRYPGVVMVSRSWDGELIDRCLRRWGYDSTRGSSSRGGKEALAEMIDMAKERSYCSGLAVDAPRGPSRKVKMGIVII